MDQLIPSLAALVGPFRDCFHPQVFQTFQALLAGWISHASVGGPALVRWCAVGFATTAATAVTTWIVWLTPDTRRALGERLSPLVATVAGAKA